MQKVCEDLQAAGVNLELVMSRFMGNEMLYINFLKRFTEDKSFQDMQSFYRQGDMEKAFKASHTLKGLIGNLGLDGIMRSINPITENLRLGSDEGVKELMEHAKEEYTMVVKILDTI